jgi:hypothetical protein
MRPVIRPDGNYHNVSMTAGALAGGIGQNHPTRCLALCIEEEINRLHAIIAALPAAGGEAAVAVPVAGVISATAIPVAIPALVVPAVPAAGGFAGGTYAAALNALPAAHQAIVDNYLHYGIIQRNLQYAVPLDGWIAGTGPRLVIGDIPYAVSAMQDTREQI